MEILRGGKDGRRCSNGRVQLVHLIILHILSTIDADSVTTTIPPIDKSEGHWEGMQLLSLWKEDVRQGNARF